MHFLHGIVANVNIVVKYEVILYVKAGLLKS
jgi:hypothetical protein